ncbi:MAG: adenylate/guanylate cyclase domain-containing protein [Deltaproteobacteria bacterium]|nr:adenylate/guanylate cyclase domain-containing protein [Deltaproteobacteria bacterium]
MSKLLKDAASEVSAVSSDSMSAWWRRVESSGGVDDDVLAQAAQAEGALRLDDADRLLASWVDDPAWSAVRALVALRIRARRANTSDYDDVDAAFAALIARVDDDTATRTRAWHSRGACQIRFGRPDDAERSLHQALAHADDARLKTWILDGIAQVYLTSGAWEEARWLLTRVIVDKLAGGDHLGVAISGGHLAVLHLMRGEPQRALACARKVIVEIGARAGPNSSMRLEGIACQAALEAGPVLSSWGDAAVAAGVTLKALVDAAPRTHSRGNACLVLARLAARASDDVGARRWLDEAKEALGGADPLLVAFWEAELFPAVRAQPLWREDMTAIVPASGAATEWEIRLRLLLASDAHERASTRPAGHPHPGALRIHLDAALDRARTSTNPLLSLLVEERFQHLDPLRFVERSHERYSGRTSDELARTTSEDATIVFCDMVGFTSMSGRLSPEDVMSTVRGLFEHAAPLMEKHRVRPIQHLGDGLLAVAQGQGHGVRGIGFARDFVARMEGVGRVRRALGETWAPALRAGVASGTVVLGLLGGNGKQEYLAIGRATNLAARLQAEAHPGEVMGMEATARAAGVVDVAEPFTLKGFDAAVNAVRIVVRAA